MSASRQSLLEFPRPASLMRRNNGEVRMGVPASLSADHMKSHVDFVGRLDARAQADLAGVSRELVLRRGDTVFRAGDPGRGVFVLRRGRVKISQRSGAGREVILWFCGEGEIFGMAEATRGGSRVVNADVSEEAVVWSVTASAFRKFVAQHPSAALLALESFAVRLRDLSDALVNIVSDDVRLRVVKVILRLGARYGTRRNDRVLVAIPLTHQEIADMIGTTRQSVTSVLNELKGAGVLAFDRHRIQIASERDLVALAGARPPGQRVPDRKDAA